MLKDIHQLLSMCTAILLWAGGVALADAAVFLCISASWHPGYETPGMLDQSHAVCSINAYAAADMGFFWAGVMASWNRG